MKTKLPPFLVAVFAGLVAVAAVPAAELRPNILLIIADQHFADAMSGAAYAGVKTPALDNLAATGARV
jgi:hypothetical protein